MWSEWIWSVNVWSVECVELWVWCGMCVECEESGECVWNVRSVWSVSVHVWWDE